MTPREDHLARQRASELLRLGDRWGEFYLFYWEWEHQCYKAVRRDNHQPLTCASAYGLGTLLEIDLSEHPMDNVGRLH